MKNSQKREEIARAQERYQAFDRRRKITLSILLIGFAALLANLLRLLYSSDDGKSILTALAIFLIYTGVDITVCSRVANMDRKLRQELYEASHPINRDTVFGEFYTKFETFPGQNQWLGDAKVIEEEVCYGYVDLVIERNGHEFLINVDKDGLYMIADEETNEPKEKNIPMAEFTDHGQIFEAIKAFVEENS